MAQAGAIRVLRNAISRSRLRTMGSDSGVFVMLRT